MMQEIKDEALKRLGHSILGTFTLYMIVTNWKVMVILLSSLEPLYKIEEIGILTENEFPINVVYSFLLTSFTLISIPYIKTIYDKWLLYKNFQVESQRERYTRQLDSENILVNEAWRFLTQVVSQISSKESNIRDRLSYLRNALTLGQFSKLNADELHTDLETAVIELEGLLIYVAEIKNACGTLELELKAADKIRK